MEIDNGKKVGAEYQGSSGFSINNLPCVFSQGGGSMKRVFLACVAVVFLFGISSVTFASGKGDDMKGKGGAMKEEGMKKADDGMGDMKGKGEEMSPEAKDKTKGNETGKPKKKPKKEPVEN